MKLLSVIPFLLFIIACSSNPKATESCQEADWYEIGRRDGANGLPMSLENKYPGFCEDSDVNANRALYENGRNAGLIEYCQPANAFELGRTGQFYFNVCPPQLEDSFISAFKKGKKLFQLQQENVQIETKIQDLSKKLREESISSVEKKVLQNALSQLKLLKAKNNTESSKLETL
jgi:hypothetical protein